ncbi:MAG: signal recognition particle-docking protein FtsY [Dehalococcoidia bacterium]|nr:signal recognition particle-docking protein FtsY [Dehalococcoidia bacterium]
MVRLFGRKAKVDVGLKKTREGVFGKLLGVLSRSSITDDTWQELEEALIAADVGVKLALDILARVRERCEREGVKDGTAVPGMLKDELLRIVAAQGAARSPLLALAQGKPLPAKPYVILIVGVNGAGKTTSIAKLAHLLMAQGKQVVLAAGDTFRAAGSEQLAIWADRVGAQVIAHQHGADPGAVAFDALEAARARNADVVIIDTAGRLHTKVNLMEELKKVHRVVQRFDPAAPHETVLVLDAVTGQNGLAQAKSFSEAVRVSGLFLAKLDGTARGGIAVAIADQLHIPILFIGTGEQLDDVAPFDPAEFVEALVSSEG